jgi:hypothetical protein
MEKGVESLTVDVFRPRVGDRFRVCPTPESRLDAELVEARALGGSASPPAGHPGRRIPFSLLFRTAAGSVMPQRIYRVEHDEIGPYDIFLVPVGKDATGVLYEAIFT